MDTRCRPVHWLRSSMKMKSEVSHTTYRRLMESADERDNITFGGVP